RFGGGVQLMDDILQDGDALFRVGSHDERVRIRFAGDAHLAIQASDVAVRGGVGHLVIVPVGQLALGLFEKQVVQNVFDVFGTGVFEVVDFWRQAVFADRFIQLCDH